MPYSWSRASKMYKTSLKQMWKGSSHSCSKEKKGSSHSCSKEKKGSSHSCSKEKKGSSHSCSKEKKGSSHSCSKEKEGSSYSCSKEKKGSSHSCSREKKGASYSSSRDKKGSSYFSSREKKGSSYSRSSSDEKTLVQDGNLRALVTDRSLFRLPLSGTTFLLTSDTAILFFRNFSVYLCLLSTTLTLSQALVYCTWFDFDVAVFTGWLMFFGVCVFAAFFGGGGGG